MNKITFSLVALIGASIAHAQVKSTQNGQDLDSTPTPDFVDVSTPRAHKITQNQDKPETVLWSEDFANGIPAGWAVVDLSGISPWKYSFGGSHGNFNGNGATAPAAPINSTTASNGFLLNDPDSANHFTYGQPSGTTYQYLESYIYTNKINLGGSYPGLVLEFQQAFRYNNAPNMNVWVSGDSITWTNFTVQDGMPNNTASPNPMLVSLNITNAIGNSQHAYIRIGWSARVYYWMIDDMLIREAPKHSLTMVRYQGAPPTDVLFRNTTSGNPRYGHMAMNQRRNMFFDANFFNFGSESQTNVKLEMDILDASNNVVATVSSPTTPTLLPGDTLSFASLTTSSGWQPSATGTYRAVYKALSDSVTISSPMLETDTLQFFVTDDRWSLDFGVASNAIGTGSRGHDDGYELGVRLDLMNDEYLLSVNCPIVAGSSTAGAFLEAEIYDTTGFTLTGGFLSSPIAAVTHTVTQADITNAEVVFDLRDQNNEPLQLSEGGYYFVVRMFSNGGVNHIEFVNDQSVINLPQACIHYNPSSGRYFTGYSNSLVQNSPHFRVITDPTKIGVSENKWGNTISVFPVPANDRLNISMTKAVNPMQATIADVTGRKVLTHNIGRELDSTVDVSSLKAGTYFITIKDTAGNSRTLTFVKQ